MTAVVSPLAGLPDGATTSVAGIVAEWQRHLTRQDRVWATGVLDVDGVEVPFEIFPKPFEAHNGRMWRGDSVTLSGRVDHRKGYPLLNVTEVAR